jgi:hypothetical protein
MLHYVTLCCTTNCHLTLSEPLHCQCTLSMHPVYAPCLCILSMHPVDARCPSILSMHPVHAHRPCILYSHLSVHPALFNHAHCTRTCPLSMNNIHVLAPVQCVHEPCTLHHAPCPFTCPYTLLVICTLSVHPIIAPVRAPCIIQPCTVYSCMPPVHEQCTCPCTCPVCP